MSQNWSSMDLEYATLREISDELTKRYPNGHMIICEVQPTTTAKPKDGCEVMNPVTFVTSGGYSVILGLLERVKLVLHRELNQCQQ